MNNKERDKIINHFETLRETGNDIPGSQEVINLVNYFNDSTDDILSLSNYLQPKIDSLSIENQFIFFFYLLDTEQGISDKKISFLRCGIKEQTIDFEKRKSILLKMKEYNSDRKLSCSIPIFKNGKFVWGLWQYDMPRYYDKDKDFNSLAIEVIKYFNNKDNNNPPSDELIFLIKYVLNNKEIKSVFNRIEELSDIEKHLFYITIYKNNNDTFFISKEKSGLNDDEWEKFKRFSLSVKAYSLPNRSKEYQEYSFIDKFLK